MPFKWAIPVGRRSGASLTPGAPLPVDFALVAYRQDKNLVRRRFVVVLRKISGSTAKDDELAAIGLDGAADQRILLQHAKALEDQGYGLDRGSGIMLPEKCGEPLEVLYRGERQPHRGHGGLRFLRALDRLGPGRLVSVG